MAGFVRYGLAGVPDAARSGKPRYYGGQDEPRVLTALGARPPEGYAGWNGSLLAKHLGDISKHQIWPVLRQHEISLQRAAAPVHQHRSGVRTKSRRHRWALPVTVGERVRLSMTRLTSRFSNAPKAGSSCPMATTTLFAAPELATGRVKAGHYQRCERVEFLDFITASSPTTRDAKFTLFCTISIPTSRKIVGRRTTKTSISISPQPTPRGSTRSRSDEVWPAPASTSQQQARD